MYGVDTTQIQHRLYGRPVSFITIYEFLISGMHQTTSNGTQETNSAPNVLEDTGENLASLLQSPSGPGSHSLAICPCHRCARTSQIALDTQAQVPEFNPTLTEFTCRDLCLGDNNWCSIPASGFYYGLNTSFTMTPTTSSANPPLLSTFALNTVNGRWSTNKAYAANLYIWDTMKAFPLVLQCTTVQLLLFPVAIA